MVAFRRNHPMALDAAEWAPSTTSFTSILAFSGDVRLSPDSTEERTWREVRLVPILLQKSEIEGIGASEAIS